LCAAVREIEEGVSDMQKTEPGCKRFEKEGKNKDRKRRYRNGIGRDEAY